MQLLENSPAARARHDARAAEHRRRPAADDTIQYLQVNAFFVCVSNFGHSTFSCETDLPPATEAACVVCRQATYIECSAPVAVVHATLRSSVREPLNGFSGR